VKNNQNYSYQLNQSDMLNQYLANLIILDSNIRNLHYNVVGKSFSGLHKKMQEYYEKTIIMIDEISERIKMLNAFPITNLERILQISKIKSLPSKDYNGDLVLQIIANDFAYMLEMTKQLGNFVTQLNDLYTIDLMTNYTKFFEKELWMIKSMEK